MEFFVLLGHETDGLRTNKRPSTARLITITFIRGSSFVLSSIQDMMSTGVFRSLRVDSSAADKKRQRAPNTKTAIRVITRH
jgi:hypothetical protein